MYYSDRTDGTNKTAVNMNNKETYRVYKVEDELLTTKTVENTLSAYRFEVIKKEGVVITSIRDDENNIELTAESDGTYKMEKDGRIRIEYEQNLGDMIYKTVYEKDIELLHIERLCNDDMPLIEIVSSYGSICLKFVFSGTDIIFNNRVYYKDYELEERTIESTGTLYNPPAEMYIHMVSHEEKEAYFKELSVIISGYEYSLYELCDGQFQDINI